MAFPRARSTGKSGLSGYVYGLPWNRLHTLQERVNFLTKLLPRTIQYSAVNVVFLHGVERFYDNP